MITTPNLGLKKPASSDVLYNVVSPGDDSWGWFNDNADVLDNAVLVSPSLSGLKVLQNSAGTITWQVVTGTGSPVLANTPTLISPILGVAKANSINAPDVNGLGLYDDSGAGIFVKDGGNVGIGTASPGSDAVWAAPALDIYGLRAALILRNSSGFSTLRMVGPGAASVDDWHINMVSGASSRISFSPKGGSLGAAGLTLLNDGTVGIGMIAPSAKLHLPSSTATANTASLKIDPGVVATTPVSGNIESDGTHLYWTDSGGVRRQLDN